MVLTCKGKELFAIRKDVAMLKPQTWNKREWKEEGWYSLLNYSVKYKTWGGKEKKNDVTLLNTKPGEKKEEKKDVTLLNIKAGEKKEGCYSILCCQPSSLSSLVCDVTQMSKPQRVFLWSVVWARAAWKSTKRQQRSTIMESSFPPTEEDLTLTCSGAAFWSPQLTLVTTPHPPTSPIAGAVTRISAMELHLFSPRSSQSPFPFSSLSSHPSFPLLDQPSS